MYKLSIIVPVYQVQLYLERCLQSILQQTYLDYELILVDDGSTDGSKDICDEYASHYNHISVIHKQNGGLSSARNAGINIASGRYIMFIDADDVIHAKTVELGMHLLEEERADIFMCPLIRFSKHDTIDVTSPLERLEGIKIISGLEAESGFFLDFDKNKFVSSCAKIYKKELFRDIRFPEGRLFEDEFVTYKLYYQCKRIIVTDTPLYYYYINENGITKNLDLNKRFDEYDAQVERMSFFRENGLVQTYHLALLEFLRTAQWDLIRCQEGETFFDCERGRTFQNQYKKSLHEAEKEMLVSFIKNYDYYVLAYPERKNSFRLKRLVYKAVGKMK